MDSITAQMQMLVTQMNTLIVQTPPTSPTAEVPVETFTNEDGVSSLERQVSELVTKISDIQESFRGIGESLNAPYQ
jgi:hypothetical protein